MGKQMDRTNVYEAIWAVRYPGQRKPAPPAAGVEARLHDDYELRPDETPFEAAEAVVVCARVLGIHDAAMKAQLAAMAEALRNRPSERAQTALAAIESFFAAER